MSEDRVFEKATAPKEVFDTDKYYQGVAIELQYHTGEVCCAIISFSNYELIQCYRTTEDGHVVLIEIDLEDYLNGTWLIRKLN